MSGPLPSTRVPGIALGSRRTPLWPAVLATVLTGMGFAALKFVLIGEIALRFDPVNHDPLMFQWLEDIVQKAVALGTLKDAITQGLAAVLTLGVLLGYLVNAPLAGAWRVAPLFVLSSAGVAIGCVLTMWMNPWLLALFVGTAYGTACAARGKAVPLLAAATGRSSTLISGLMNAALVISLLAGTVFGILLSEFVDSEAGRHWTLFVFLIIAAALGFLVNPPEPPAIPFAVGMRELALGTLQLVRDRWALIFAGGIAWGVASAAVLAAFIDAIDRMGMKPEIAVILVIFPAVGAIVGNLASHWMSRRRQVIGCLWALALLIGCYQFMAWNMLSAGIALTIMGGLFAAPTNVLDARLLAYAASQGNPGRGSTVMSLTHNIFILAIGGGLAVPLFLALMKPAGQFYCLAGASFLAGLVVLKAQLREHGAVTVTGARAVSIPGAKAS